MRWSQWYIPTLKEAPGDAEVISHKLLIRAGMIRKLTSGIYTWLPLGLRTLNKAANIVREEMNRAGAQEVLMPTVQPADLWRESGRWEHYGKELLRFKDRHERDYCLGPTHEEVITDLIRGEVRSYRQLPMNLYQIQTKFRDEIRPRFGLMRGREFLMKDAYSFDKDDAGADISYKKMFEAYKKIFSRMALQFRPVEADSGSIGGNFSHEFMVLAETGEDTIAYCTGCDWSANIERAAVLAPAKACEETCAAIEEVTTPDQHTIEEVCGFLKVPAQKLIKTLLYVVDGKPVAALVRGDRELNEIKLKNYFKADEVVLASPEQVTQWTNAPVGFAGPVGFTAGPIVADHELMAGTDWIAGANKADTHILHVDLKRDVPAFAYADLRSIAEGAVKGVHTSLKTRFVFQILLRIAGRFLKNLRMIERDFTRIEKRLYDSLKNEELIQLLGLSKSLVYFSSSLKGNEVTMEKVLRGRVLKLYEDCLLYTSPSPRDHRDGEYLFQHYGGHDGCLCFRCFQQSEYHHEGFDHPDHHHDDSEYRVRLLRYEYR